MKIRETIISFSFHALLIYSFFVFGGKAGGGGWNVVD
jgi:hypothetical protein